MADVKLTCAQCGREVTVSEYADPASLVCSGCRTPLTLPEREKEAPLKVRRLPRTSSTALSGNELAIDVRARARAGQELASVLRDVHKVRTKVKKTRALWTWLMLLTLAAALAGWQYAVAHELGPKELIRWYVPGRNLLAGLVFLGVLVVAFRDGPLQGILCLLVPFYVLYYVLVRMEYPLLRGAALAIGIGLASEVYFVPNHSLATAAQRGTDQFIKTVGRLIQRAGEPPGLPDTKKEKPPKPAKPESQPSPAKGRR